MWRCCGSCVHWDRSTIVCISCVFHANCACPDKPPSTGLTEAEDICKHYEEADNE